ncbi:DNA polymerase III subunit alpha [Ferrovum sp.]|uniref:DNA polymerase III subunit alpha n=5 Tax=Ferrovum sp. TaxID=2609467 RepID=UPI002614E817|nr:DNA polymerase III subunit alpha [Ferrovum sp.]
MSAPPFIHLRLHSEFSISDGLVRIDEAVELARSLNMGALALTDLNNLFGWVRFYLQARKAGLKPIAGAEVWIAPDESYPHPFRVVLLAGSLAGYHALCRLLSAAWREHQAQGIAHVPLALLTQEKEGLLVLSGADRGDVGQALGAGQWNLARERALAWKTRWGDDYYLEVQRIGDPARDRLCEPTVQLAAELDIPVVATHPIQFPAREDFKAHEARVCIAEGRLLADPKRPRLFTPEQYFKSPDEMAELFRDLPAALANSVEIARRCSLELTLGKPRLPDFPTPAGITLDDFLRQQAQAGLEHRLTQLYPDETLRQRETATYRERLDFECQTIVQMGFSGYFLIVADFINWSKHHGVPVGPGRGSGAGSLVAFSLGITDIDPLRYDLLFERFLNPERVSMPDFDIDFCQDGRDRVIDYVRERYGRDSVAQIATFGTMAAKAVIRDVGRVLDLPYNFVDQLAKLIPFEIGMTLTKARAQEPQINQRAAQEEEVAELLTLAESLEGLTRNVGMHAGGVLIAPGKLTDFTPLYQPEGSEAVVSQYDKDDVEKVGLVKFDFLGLRTLTILDWAVRHIRERARTPGERHFTVEQIPLDDPKTYALFGSGNTTAVFQQESRTAKDMEKRLRPDNFEDIIALMALNRPGPLQSGMVDDFIQRKQGNATAEYFHQSLEPVLRPTYGVIVYQEQVMQIAQILAGYTLGAADLLRRAMGKKDSAEMGRQRSRFIEGATTRGISVKLATQLFDLMEKFAEYGFNKSHSAAYALISYQTAWLKTHYPAEFMAATLSGDLDDTDKVALFVADARQNGLVILPPDVNTSDYRFRPAGDDTIRYGLGSVKGTGEGAALEILKQRSGTPPEPYRSLFDFCRRTDKRSVNRRVIEALIKAGAFDTLHPNRAAALNAVESALNHGEQAQRHAQQEGLFDALAEPASNDPPLPPYPEWSPNEQLTQEKSVLGYYFSGHPFTHYRPQLQHWGLTPLEQLAPRAELIRVAGIVVQSRVQQTRRGRMGMVMLDDGSARVEITVFSELFDQVRPLLKEDRLLVVEGKATLDNFTQGVRLTAEQVLSLPQAQTRFARQVTLEVSRDQSTKTLSLLKELRPSFQPGPCAFVLRYCHPEVEASFRLPDFQLDETLWDLFRARFGETTLTLDYGSRPVNE